MARDVNPIQALVDLARYLKVLGSNGIGAAEAGEIVRGMILRADIRQAYSGISPIQAEMEKVRRR